MSDEATLGHSFYADQIGTGVNRLACECGAELYPDCDVSSASIANEFLRHRTEMASV